MDKQKLWLISCPAKGFDLYDSAVVVAPNEDVARTIHPDGSQRWHEGRGWVYSRGHDGQGYGWTYPSNEALTVRLVGGATNDLEEGQVICASYNAE